MSEKRLETKCFVPGCENTSASRRLTFFPLPTEISRREKWIQILNIEEDKILLSSLVCSDHFKTDQFTSVQKYQLTKYATPFPSKSSSIPPIGNAGVGPVSEEFARSLPNVKVVLHRLTNDSTSRVHIRKQVIRSAKCLSGSQLTAQRGIRDSPQSSTIFPGPSAHFMNDHNLGAPATKKRKSDFNLVPAISTTALNHRRILLPRPRPVSNLRLPAVLTPATPQITTGGIQLPIQSQSNANFQPNVVTNLQIQMVGQQQQGSVSNNTIQLPPTNSNFRWVYIGNGSNGIPCLAQIQVPSQTSQPVVVPKTTTSFAPGISLVRQPLGNTQTFNSNQSISVSTSSNIVGNRSVINLNLNPIESRIEYVGSSTSINLNCQNPSCTTNEQCMMCNKMISCSNNPHVPTGETEKIFRSLLKILKLTSDGEEHEEIGTNECPFCIFCIRQVKELVDMYNQLLILQDRFHLLRKNVLSDLTNSFCQRKAKDEDDEDTKAFYGGVSISHKLVNKWSGFGSKPGDLRSETVSNITFPNIRDEGTALSVRSDFEPDPLDISENFDQTFVNEDFDFELEDDDYTRPSCSEKVVDFVIPDNTGEVEFCFDGKRVKNPRVREKWEALWKCPETRTGLEKLIPISFRRVTCPVCGKKFPPHPFKVDSHLALHSTLSKKTVEEIKARLLAVSRERVTYKERATISKKKLRVLAKYSDGNPALHIPVDFRMVKCLICDKKMLHNSLTAHMNCHAGKKPYSCKLCPKTFRSEPNLLHHRRIDHLQKVHFSKNNYFCDLCEKFYYFKTCYVNHILAQHSSDMDVNSGIFYFYNCDYEGCLKSYRQKEDFVQHLRTHDNESFECSSCEKVFATSENYKEHSTKLHNDDGAQAHFVCKYCPQIFEIESVWAAHELTHAIDMSNEQRTHLCDECGRSFQTYHKLYVHRYITHKKKLISESVSSEVPISRANRTHPSSERLLTKSGKNPNIVTCHVCGKDVYKNTLTSHLLDIHTYENKLECYICRQAFKKITRLETHILRHQGQPRKTAKEVCIYCLDELPTVLRMREHCINQHADQYLLEKPFYCSVCFLRFVTNEDLSAHQLAVHEQWKCKVCGKQLRGRIFFEEHTRSHTGEQPFKCKICDKGFAYFYNLREHEMRHRGDKPYSCVHCSLGFFRKNKLQEHIENEHRGENERLRMSTARAVSSESQVQIEIEVIEI